GQGSGYDRRRKNRRQRIYPRQDHAVHHLPWTGSHGRRGYSADCGTVAELHRAADVGYAAGDTKQRSGAADESRSCEFDAGAHAGHRGLRFIASPCERDTVVKANFLISTAERRTDLSAPLTCPGG